MKTLTTVKGGLAMTAEMAVNDAGAVVSLALALERLVAQVTRYLDADAGEGVPIEDGAWAAAHAHVVSIARECAGALDDPRVVTALTR